MADRTVYVTGSASGTPGTDGATYATLQACITGEVGAAPDLVTDTAILNIELSAIADTTACTIAGFTTSSSYYPNIYCAAGAGHSGVWDTNKYRLSVSNSNVLTIQDEWVRLDGLQIEQTSASVNNQSTIIINTVGTTDMQFSNLITRHASDDFRCPGIWVNDASLTLYIWNWIDYGHSTNASLYNSSLVVDIGATVHISSSTLVGRLAGIWVANASATVNARNVYAGVTSAGNGAFFVSSGTLNQTTCASSDTTADGTALDSIAINTTNFTNVTAGSEDFTLPDSSSALYNVGTDGPQAAPLDFTTSIEGVTKTSTWDVGASEVDDGGRASKNTHPWTLGMAVGMEHGMGGVTA